MKLYLTKLYWQSKTHPPTAWMGFLLLLLYLSPFLGVKAQLSAAILLLLFLLLALDAVLMKWDIPFLSRRIGEHFYALRSLGGWYGISQRTRVEENCRSMLRSLSSETGILVHLPQGRYRTRTHQTVLHRLQQAENVSLLRCIPIYKSDLKSTLNRMTAKRCNSCATKCAAYQTPPRQFYFVEFQIRSI